MIETSSGSSCLQALCGLCDPPGSWGFLVIHQLYHQCCQYTSCCSHGANGAGHNWSKSEPAHQTCVSCRSQRFVSSSTSVSCQPSFSTKSRTAMLPGCFFALKQFCIRFCAAGGRPHAVCRAGQPCSHCWYVCHGHGTGLPLVWKCGCPVPLSCHLQVQCARGVVASEAVRVGLRVPVMQQ